MCFDSHHKCTSFILNTRHCIRHAMGVDARQSRMQWARHDYMSRAVTTTLTG
eukprot:m.1435218 g.1435218  ORF g.1435218 m.1435218 type:complete len:52 (-) comp25081_c2_seq39:1864-2019(-)